MESHVENKKSPELHIVHANPGSILVSRTYMYFKSVFHNGTWMNVLSSKRKFPTYCEQYINQHI